MVCEWIADGLRMDWGLGADGLWSYSWRIAAGFSRIRWAGSAADIIEKGWLADGLWMTYGWLTDGWSMNDDVASGRSMAAVNELIMGLNWNGRHRMINNNNEKTIPYWNMQMHMWGIIGDLFNAVDLFVDCKWHVFLFLVIFLFFLLLIWVWVWVFFYYYFILFYFISHEFFFSVLFDW